jgi:hypothetical protein
MKRTNRVQVSPWRGSTEYNCLCEEDQQCTNEMTKTVQVSPWRGPTVYKCPHEEDQKITTVPMKRSNSAQMTPWRGPTEYKFLLHFLLIYRKLRRWTKCKSGDHQRQPTPRCRQSPAMHLHRKLLAHFLMCARVEVLTVVLLKIHIFWGVTPCLLAHSYQLVKGSQFLHL